LALDVNSFFITLFSIQGKYHYLFSNLGAQICVHGGNFCLFYNFLNHATRRKWLTWKTFGKRS